MYIGAAMALSRAKAFWIMQTLGMSQLMLDAGADDLDGPPREASVVQVRRQTLLEDLLVDRLLVPRCQFPAAGRVDRSAGCTRG